jgi:Glycosyl transferase family 90
LEPWKHYIPLTDDLSDVEEKMQWVIDNDRKAQEIAEHGRLWISDLVYHPDADRDEANIFREMFERYKRHFAQDESLSKDTVHQEDQ